MLRKHELGMVVLALFVQNAWASDNSVYMDQAGDNSSITITQDGAGNRVRGILLNGNEGHNNDYSVLEGNHQTILIHQVGQNNILSMGLKTSVGANGQGINLTYIVTHGNNTGYINSNNAGAASSQGNTVTINQSGGSALTNLNLLGADNTLSVTSAGGANNEFRATINADQTTTTINQTGGGGNETTLNLTGDRAQININTLGANNITNLTQSASNITGAEVIIDIAGSGNNTTITQSSLFDHYAKLDLKAGSNDNTITINQSGGSNQGNKVILELQPGSSNNTLSITQQGTIDNLSNVKLSGNQNSVTILQKN